MINFGFGSVPGRSYNLPKLCPSASWDPDAITVVDSSATGMSPNRLFVSLNNTIYTTDANIGRVYMWIAGNSTPARIISESTGLFWGIFASANGDIYVDNGAANGRVDTWTPDGNSSTVELYVTGSCHSLFIDRNDNLYCSFGDTSQIIKKLLGASPNTSTVVAGTGSSGSTSDALDNPRGLVVNDNLTLYVADFGNNRVQMFPLGQLNGTTVAGNGAPGTVSLNGPVGVILDADGYLFIAARDNNRIVGSGPNGFRCIAGCTSSAGNAANELSGPRNLAFDSDGNLVVADTDNARIQKFILATNSCGKLFSMIVRII